MNKSLILVVEDDKSVRNLITTTLKTHEYRYLTAPDGQSAILETSSHNPDIVLLDLGLPDIDGVEIIKKIRTWSNMPIIVISARSEDTDKIDALDAGADDYLTKPFSVEELLARLRVTQRRLSMMQKVSPAEAVVFVNGKLRVDYAAGCAYLNEEELHLTPIEYKLLCLLTRNIGKVLTHTFLTQSIEHHIFYSFQFLHGFFRNGICICNVGKIPDPESRYRQFMMHNPYGTYLNFINKKRSLIDNPHAHFRYSRITVFTESIGIVFKNNLFRTNIRINVDSSMLYPVKSPYII